MFKANVTQQIHRLHRALKDWMLVSSQRWKDDEVKRRRHEAAGAILVMMRELIRDVRFGKWIDESCQEC